MGKSYCYIPKDIDGKILEVLDCDGRTRGLYNVHRIASLRGMYDANHSVPLDTSNIAEAAEKLVEYRGELRAKSISEAKKLGTNLASNFNDLKTHFTAEERYNRINMISMLFSYVVDGFVEANPGLSRNMVLQGFTINGNHVLGEFEIFEQVYDILLNRQAEYAKNQETEKAEKIKKVLENWPALLTHARTRLRNTEGIKLGNELSFSERTSEINYGDNDLSKFFDPDAAPREHWMTIHGMESSFGTIGQQVRRVLGSIPIMVQAGEKTDDVLGATEVQYVPKRDDLDCPITLDPVRAHQILLNNLRGVSTEEGMLRALSKKSKSYPWMGVLYNVLNNDPRLRTQFHKDLKRNFQLYGAMTEAGKKVKGAIKNIKTYTLNKIEDLLIGSFTARITFGKVLHSSKSVYDSKGNVNVKNLQSLFNDVDKWLNKATKDESTSDQPADDPFNLLAQLNNYGNKNTSPKFYKATVYERREFVLDTFRALGIDADADTVAAILSNYEDMKELTAILKSLVKYSVSNATWNILSKGKPISYRMIINKPSNNTKVGSLLEHIQDIHLLVSKHREGVRFEHKAKWKNSKGDTISLYSHVTTSFMGDMFDKIQDYVNNNDKKGLQEYITDNYLISPMFVDENNKILNKWIEELLKSCESKKHLKETFAGKFDYMRFVGDDNQDFENFTSKQHMVSMLVKYRELREQSNNNSEYAKYPVFILGDSGVSKYITAKRYTESEILEGLYNVYKQEIARKKLVTASNEYLAKKHPSGLKYKTIKHFSETSDKFITLPFLNKGFKAADGTVDKYYNMLSSSPREEEVKAAILSYMKDSVEEFKKQLDSLGILERDEQGKGIYFGHHQGSLNDEISDFFWNTKFATIQQFQMMTVDTAFYASTKDLQKRYKEIHAPGVPLSVDAIDTYAEPKKEFDGTLTYPKYSDDAYESAVYFDEIIEGASEDFLKVVEQYHGPKSKIYKDYASNNKVTDGQGYRTLTSYRKVLGMAGQWTPEMEKAYRAIMALRAEYTDINGELKEIPAKRLTEISNMAVVFQPIKPFLFTHERLPINDKDTLLVPVQHKYAEAVLIPELLPAGSKLRDLATWMETNDVDLVGSTEIVKVGCFGQTNISGASNRQELMDALDKAYVHKLSYSGYKIQTNVPEHINSSQLFGTQLRKLIMAGIKLNDTKYSKYINSEDGKVNLGGNIGKVSLNGRNLINFYNSLIVANILESLNKFTTTIANSNSISKRLIQGVINNDREALDNLLAYALNEDTKDITMPLFEGGLEHDSSGLLLSIFKKLVNKQDIKGGSCVQVSAMGINSYSNSGDLEYVVSEDGKNILYAECEIPFDISYKDENDNEVFLDYDTYCYADGTLKMSDDNKTPLIEKHFPGSTSLVAYRIPTERAYSMINLKVKRFSRKTAGGTIKVPIQGTTIAGFDFDIDKLYFMRREYVRKSYYSQDTFSDEEKYRIFGEIYDRHGEIKTVLENIRDASGEFDYFTEKGKDGKDYRRKVYKHPLNHYWNQMMAENPSLASDPAYDKKALFNEAAASLIAKGELEAREGNKSFSLDEYDYNKTPLENSRAARNNMLIDLIQQRLMDEDTLEQRITPGGFATSSQAAKVMRHLMFGSTSKLNGQSVLSSAMANAQNEDIADPEPNYDPSDPMTMVIYNQQNQVASKLIGIFANQNTNHAFTSLMKSFRLKKAIAFAGHSYGDGLTSDFLQAPRGVNVDLHVAELLAASVDAVKDPVLNFLNLNTVTADSGAMLTRIGYTPTEIGLLFNQPIIKELCDFCFNNNMSTKAAIGILMNKYTKKLKIKNPFEDKNRVRESRFLTSERLADNIVTSRNNYNEVMENNDFLLGQLEILDLFKEISITSGEVSQLISSTKFTASNAVGSTFGDLYAQQMKVQKYIDSFDDDARKVEMVLSDSVKIPISTNADLASRPLRSSYTSLKEYRQAVKEYNKKYIESMLNNPFAYEQAMFDANRNALKALSKYYPYENKVYEKARKRLASLTEAGVLDAKAINSIHSELMVYLLSNQSNSLFNGDLELEITEANGSKTSISARTYYTRDFGQDLLEYLDKNPSMKELAIFKYLIPEIKEYDYTTDERGNIKDVNEVISMNMQGIGGMDSNVINEIMESWADLLRIKDDNNPKVAEDARRTAIDLFMYNYYKLGFNFSPKSFMNLAPTEVKQAIQVPRYDGSERSYVQFMQEILEDKYDIDADEFAEQHILNNTHKREYVLEPKSDSFVDYINRQIKIPGSPLASTFTIDISDVGGKGKLSTSDVSSVVIRGKHEKNVDKVFAPVIKIVDGNGTEHFYMANTFDAVPGVSMTYTKKEKLGSKGVSIQYFGDAGYTNSDKTPVNPQASDGEAGTTDVTDLNPPTSPESYEEVFDKDAYIEYIVDRYMAVGNALQFPGINEEAIRAELNSSSSDIIKTRVKEIREMCRNAGVKTIDKNGNDIEIC